VAWVVVIRDRDPGGRRARGIVATLQAHGMTVRAGPTADVSELWIADGEGTLGAIRRRLVQILDRDAPGWQHDVALYWPDPNRHPGA
jgi:hypothetical protein